MKMSTGRQVFIKILKNLKKFCQSCIIIFLTIEKKLSELQMNNVNHDDQPKERIVCDFIASMTDRYAMNLYRKIFFPSPVV